MFRLPSFLCAALLMTSAVAFAADTPDPSSTGGTSVPIGANANQPTTPPAGTATYEVKTQNPTCHHLRVKRTRANPPGFSPVDAESEPTWAPTMAGVFSDG